MQLFDLSGKTALVTGCNKGIGKSMAVGLAEAGAGIIGVSASLQLQGSEVEKEVTATGRKFTAYQADISDRTKLYAFAEKALADQWSMVNGEWSMVNGKWRESKLQFIVDLLFTIHHSPLTIHDIFTLITSFFIVPSPIIGACTSSG